MVSLLQKWHGKITFDSHQFTGGVSDRVLPPNADDHHLHSHEPAAKPHGMPLLLQSLRSGLLASAESDQSIKQVALVKRAKEVKLAPGTAGAVPERNLCCAF